MVSSPGAVHDQLAAVRGAGLPQDAADVVLDRLLRQAQVRRDLVVRVPAQQQHEDLLLAVRHVRRRFEGIDAGVVAPWCGIAEAPRAPAGENPVQRVDQLLRRRRAVYEAVGAVRQAGSGHRDVVRAGVDQYRRRIVEVLEPLAHFDATLRHVEVGVQHDQADAVPVGGV
jgi:hypothetical protein